MHIVLLFRYFKSHIKKANELLKSERTEVYRSCSSIFRIITRIMVLIFGLLIFAGTPFFTPAYRSLYITAFVISLLLCIGFSLSYRKQGAFALPLMYAFALYLYAFTILISLRSANGGSSHAATCFVCLQIIFPLLIFDKSVRVDALVIFVYLLHSALAWRYKDFANFTLDVFNGAAFTLVGIVIGEYERYIRLINFEKDRVLIYQKNTDILTGLPNRRSLFERMSAVEEHSSPLTGLFMLDIDYFKRYNDSLGHQQGDSCLSKLGLCFQQWGDRNGFTFYRYGGEEFIAATASDSPEQLKEHAESLRQAVEDLAIPFPQEEHPVVTISLGFTPHFYTQSYEETIRRADDALYTAKRLGRNRVCGNS